ncbi:MAG TPA: hypothetical protein VF175_13475 [Lacipirellula sp.]
MRTIALASLLTLLTPAAAHARLFWQTYGATVSTADGCHWNINQDYFVPRHCHSGRYGLFSACKQDHGISAACKNLHPLYHGYCTPYGACRYRWRDHVYKTYCGCTPLKHVFGPWHLEKCDKHPLVLRHVSSGCNACGAAGDVLAPGRETLFVEPACDWYCNVEPFGGETLGSIAAIAAGSGGAAAAPAAPVAAAQPMPPKLNLTPAAAPSSGGLPAPFNF